MEFASVRLNTLIELAEYSTVTDAPQNPRSIFLLTEDDDGFDAGLMRWNDVEEEYEGVGRSDEEITQSALENSFVRM